MDYENTAFLLKALADPNRLKIVDILSSGSQCACNLLPHFGFTQPALSHHMKILEKAGVVITEKIGTWNHYSLNEGFIENFHQLCAALFSADETDKAACQAKAGGCRKTTS